MGAATAGIVFGGDGTPQRLHEPRALEEAKRGLLF
jgi:hypothetical protein